MHGQTHIKFFCILISFFEKTNYKLKCHLVFLRCVVYSVQFKSLHKIIPKYLQLLVSGNFVNEGVTQWIFNPSSRKSYCLHLPGFIYTQFSTANLFTPHFLQSIPPGCPDPSAFSTYCTVVGEESNIRVDVPPNIINLH